MAIAADAGAPSIEALEMTGTADVPRGRAALRAVSTDAEGGIPFQFGDDPYVWACWLYYEDRMTQADIAQAMGISRATVNTYLAEARDRGIVDISLEPSRLASLTLALELKKKFGLRDCLVIPSGLNDQSLVERLGIAGELALRRFVQSGDVIAAVGGRTVAEAAKRLKIAGLQDITVVQAVGSAAAAAPFSSEQCASALAAAVGAQCINLAAPALVSSSAVRDTLLGEPLLKTQLDVLRGATKAVFGISSLQPNATTMGGGFFDPGELQKLDLGKAVGAIAARFFDGVGRPAEGVFKNRIIGISLDELRDIPTRIAIAGGFAKVPAILGALRGEYCNVLVTDAATARGVLRAAGVTEFDRRPAARTKGQIAAGHQVRQHVKKFINGSDEVVDEMLEGALMAHRSFVTPLAGSRRAIVARNGPREGKVGLVIGGGSGHEPCFLGYVGAGLADAVAVGNIFSTPPPEPIVRCVEAASGGAGVLLAYGNYVGDVMNFEMAAELALARGIETRSVVTTDDVASAAPDNRVSRRGVAGNVFVFKIAGAACDRGLPLETCEAVTRKANERTYTVGMALEPCSLPQTRRRNFEIGPDEIEIGVGIHGEPGVMRGGLPTADKAADMMLDRIFDEMRPQSGDRVAVLVNSLGGTPLMELYILYRRAEQRLAAKGVRIDFSLVGHYCTSVDMIGASVSIMHLDGELHRLLHHPCRTATLQMP